MNYPSDYYNETGYSMGKILLCILMFAGIKLGCSSNPIEIKNTSPSVEGVVNFVPPTMAIGGEADPSGFILTNCRWISGQPAFPYSRIYIDGQINSSYLEKRVRVTGNVETITAGGVETPKRTFLKIQVEQIKVID